ncbi:MAG TPA: cyclase family protein, partial [Methylomirabilota bacterium]|nr:cyclase family protein [Methylomirabilota bacterium]
MPKKPLPTEQEVRSYIRDRRNWGRWGKDDQRGAINLITPAKRAAAARLVKTGRSISLSRPFPKDPGMNNALPAQHYMRTHARGKGAFAADYYGIYYH